MTQIPTVNFEGLSYSELASRLDSCELLGFSYQDLLTDLQRDLLLGIDGMPVQNAKPADGSVLVWKQSKGAWIPGAGPQPGDLVWSMAAARSGAYPADGLAYTLSAHPELANLASKCPAWVSGGVLTMPNVAGRTVVGSGTGAGLTTRTLGQTFGEEAHQLTTAELASHAHVVAMRNDGSIISGNIQLASSGNTYAFASNGTFGNNTGGGGNGDTVSTGGGGGHNNMQPSIVLNPFILY